MKGKTSPAPAPTPGWYKAVMIKNMDTILTPKEVQKMLKCSLPHIYKMAERGQLPCVRWKCPGEGKQVRTMVRFKLSDILNFVEENYSG